MPYNTIDFYEEYKPEELAIKISELWNRWKDDSKAWELEATDIRNTVFASTIDTTTNDSNPFLNRTTVPKLAQIYDNLIANYDASLFPNNDWFMFEATSRESAMVDKKHKVRDYIKTKTRQLRFRTFMRQVLADWILYGNCYVGLDFIHERVVDPDTKNVVDGYIGPKPYRISPYDIKFDVRADSFKSAPKIIRTLKTIGQIKKEVTTHPNLNYTDELVKELTERRSACARGGNSGIYEEEKIKSLVADGFGTMHQYYCSGLVEVLEFYGDIFIENTGEILPNYHITVIDRCKVLVKEPIKTWNGEHHVYHCAWRNRPDNILGMSPLANLLGMQHRLDKLENTKADVFDQIAYPIVHEKGDVEYYDGDGNLNGIRGTPGGIYRSDTDGDVNYLRPDATALNADFQIDSLQQRMEELAGAPKNTMGIRTPGEKTAFEVQTLDNAASRIFQNKIAYFEEEFLEPILNGMLEIARRNLDVRDVIKMTNSTLGVDSFVDITKDDLMAAGRLYAVGSRYFQRNAIIAQNLTQLSQSPLLSAILPHFSRMGLAKLFEELLNLDQFSLVRENVGIEEDLETQRLVQVAQQTAAAEDQTPAEGQMPQ